MSNDTISIWFAIPQELDNFDYYVITLFNVSLFCFRWNYCITSILEEDVRRRAKMWSWKSIKKHRWTAFWTLRFWWMFLSIKLSICYGFWYVLWTIVNSSTKKFTETNSAKVTKCNEKTLLMKHTLRVLTNDKNFFTLEENILLWRHTFFKNA